MMNIKAYYDKIEAVLSSRQSTKTSKSKKKGLLAQSSEQKPTGKEKNQMMTIVEIIEGIREAREEIKNGRK